MKKRSEVESKTIRKIYEYREIGSIEEESQESINFYAVVIDACFPYKVDEKKYMCYLKVVDPSCNVSEKNDQFAIVAIQARRFEDLPIIQRVGDILRIHRADYNLKEEQIYFKLNMSYSSSWALFSADDEVAPEVIKQDGEEFNSLNAYAFSGKQYTFEAQDHKMLRSIRQWNKGYMSKNIVIIIPEMYSSLDEADKEEGDFNVVAKVTQIIHRDQYTSDIRLKDVSKATWFLTVLKRKFPRLQENIIIKIRSVNIDKETERERCLELAPHSNIMTFVPFSMLNQKLIEEISMDSEKVDKELFKKPILTEPVLATRVLGKFADYPVKSLSELFEDPNTKETTFRARFYIIKITPDEAEKFVEMYTPKESKETPSMKKPKGKDDAAYKIQFLVKDSSVALNDNLYKVYLYSHKGYGKEFFPKIEPSTVEGSNHYAKLLLNS